jgi:hypothetical protein
MNPKNIEAFGAKLDEARDWLYDADEATTAELVEKLNDLSTEGREK